MDIVFQKVIIIHFAFKNVPKRLQLQQLLFKQTTRGKKKKKNYITGQQFTQMDSSLFASQNAPETFVEGETEMPIHSCKLARTRKLFWPQREAPRSTEKCLHVLLFCHQQIPVRPLKTCLYDPKANGRSEPDYLTVFIQEEKGMCNVSWYRSGRITKVSTQMLSLLADKNRIAALIGSVSEL